MQRQYLQLGEEYREEKKEKTNKNMTRQCAASFSRFFGFFLIFLLSSLAPLTVLDRPSILHWQIYSQAKLSGPVFFY
jgi:hypothetical protein